MAQAYAKKLPYKQSSNYSSCQLSDVNTAQQLLTGLTLAFCNPATENNIPPLKEEPKPESYSYEREIGAQNQNEDSMARHYVVSTRMSCGFCTSVFSSRDEQKSHFKSDWHRYNLKQHLRRRKPVSEEIFEEMTGEVSSISGSEDSSESSKESADEAAALSSVPPRLKRSASDSSEGETEHGSPEDTTLVGIRKLPKLFLKNNNGQLLSVYHCVLYHRKHPPSVVADLLKLVTDAVNYSRVSVILLAGGHFAAAVFDGNQAVVHKTFHRYVVRAKRGTVQSIRDNQGNAPKSAGASLRRYNEAALAQEIQELLTSWSAHLEACHLIFLKASTYSRHIFFGGKSPLLSKRDLRIRVIPFNTARPTHNELKRVHHMLMSVECYGAEADMIGFLPKSPPRFTNSERRLVEASPGVTQQPNHGLKKELQATAARKSAQRLNTELQELVGATAAAEDTDGDTATEVELVEKVTEINTRHLMEFDVSDGRQKKRRNKKPGQKSSFRVASKSGDDKPVQDDEHVDLKNRLYTACRSGNHKQLLQILTLLRITNNPEKNNLSNVDSQTKVVEKIQILESESVPELVSNDHHHHRHRQDGELLVSEQGDGTEKDEACDAHVASSSRRDADSAQSKGAICLHHHQEGSSAAVDDGTVKSVDDAVRTCAEQNILHLLNDTIGDRRCTLLHIASAAGHAEIVQTLLETGCDPASRDSAGKTPYIVADGKEVKNTFRRFRGSHPDMYDYDAAQIPGALTPEMEMERKKKESEKKKMQKKARQERLKDRKAEEVKATAEQKERERFLALSDREKRALAAERRLLQQSTASGGVPPVLSRCFQCGADLTGKVPFEYSDFKFCMPKCLKEHRIKNCK